MEGLLQWLIDNRPLLIAAVAVLLFLVVLRRLLGGAVRAIRRRKAGPLHPRLQKYGGRSEADWAAEQREAEKIVATSSTPSIAGYEIIRQVEAVFVEGLRSQSEAITSLKAAAARRGANALINVTQEHTAAGRCTAQGDAVVVKPLVAPDPPAPPGRR